MLHSDETDNNSRSATAARVLLYCLLVWAPLPLGSNRGIFWVVNGLIITLIAGLFLAGEFGSQSRAPLDWRPAVFAAPILGLWLIWMVVQTVPGLPELLQHPIWAEFSDDIPGTSGTISISPSTTWATIAQIVPVIILSVVAFRLGADPNRGRFLLKLITATTTGIAAYGLIAQYFGFRQVFLLETVAYEGFLTGTFINRSDAAVFFAIGLATGLSLIASQVETSRIVDRAGRGTWLSITHVARHSGAYVAACVILAAAVPNTGSRGGMIAGIVAVASVALLATRGDAAKRSRVWIAIAGVIVLLLLIAAASSGRVLPRFETDVSDNARWLLYQDVFEMIGARPFLGHGGGTFPEAYPLFHNRAPADLFWNRAHNSYLQAVAEVGIPVFIVVMSGICVVMVYIIRRIVNRMEPMPVAIAGAGAALAVAALSLIDDSIQVQAIAITLATLVAAGLGEAAAPVPRKRHNSER